MELDRAALDLALDGEWVDVAPRPEPQPRTSPAKHLQAALRTTRRSRSQKPSPSRARSSRSPSLCGAGAGACSETAAIGVDGLESLGANMAAALAEAAGEVVTAGVEAVDAAWAAAGAELPEVVEPAEACFCRAKPLHSVADVSQTFHETWTKRSNVAILHSGFLLGAIAEQPVNTCFYVFCADLHHWFRFRNRWPACC